MTTSIQARQARTGQWIEYTNSRFNERIVETSWTRDGLIKIRTDYGNGGEPATHFFEANELIAIA